MSKRIWLIALITILITSIIGVFLLAQFNKPHIALNYNALYFSKPTNLSSIELKEEITDNYSFYSASTDFDKITSKYPVQALEKIFQFNSENIDAKTIIRISGADSSLDTVKNSVIITNNLSNRDTFFKTVQSDGFLNLLTARQYSVIDSTNAWEYSFNSSNSRNLCLDILKQYFIEITENGFNLSIDRTKVSIDIDGEVALDVIVSKKTKQISSMTIRTLGKGKIDFGTGITSIDSKYKTTVNQNLTINFDPNLVVKYSVVSSKSKDENQKFSQIGVIDNAILNLLPF